MDKELNCDFYIGDRVSYPIELMKYESLKGFKRKLRFSPVAGGFHWQAGALSLAFKPYKHYILTGDPFCFSTWFILLLNRISFKRSYLWTHGWYGDESGLKKLIKKLFFNLSHKVLLYGDYARNLMLGEGFRPEKLVTIYNSLDYDNQVKIRNSLNKTSVYRTHFSNDNPVLLYVGRIQSKKKIELLIDALHELGKNNSHYNLILIGEQTDKTDINFKISQYGLDKYVWFYGPCYDENILGELIFNADVCVSPGNVGLTAMHSMVYGTPVITHNNFFNQMPEFEAIEKGITGDFFIENSLGDLCEKIVTWTNLSKEIRETVRSNCYKVIQNKYNPNIQIDKIKELISNL